MSRKSFTGLDLGPLGRRVWHPGRAPQPAPGTWPGTAGQLCPPEPPTCGHQGLEDGEPRAPRSGGGTHLPCSPKGSCPKQTWENKGNLTSSKGWISWQPAERHKNENCRFHWILKTGIKQKREICAINLRAILLKLYLAVKIATFQTGRTACKFERFL